MGAGVYGGPPICGSMRGDDPETMCLEPRPADQPGPEIGSTWSCPKCGATRTLIAKGDAGPAPAPFPPGTLQPSWTAVTIQPKALDLDAIEARAAAAQKGPWFVGFEDGSGAECGKEGATITAYAEGFEMVGRLPIIMGADFDGCSCGVLVQRDATFIAAARSDVPALVAEVRRLRAQLANEKAAAT